MVGGCVFTNPSDWAKTFLERILRQNTTERNPSKAHVYRDRKQMLLRLVIRSREARDEALPASRIRSRNISFSKKNSHSTPPKLVSKK
jgi:hypothetical protein